MSRCAVLRRISFALTLLVIASLARADETPWKAGAAAVKITPERPVVLLGYTGREGPFTSVAQDIWAKALALEDPAGHRAVIVTADLVGFQAANTTDRVCKRLTEETGLPRERLLFNASHTHTGPVVSHRPRRTSNVAHPAMTDADAAASAAYAMALEDKLVALVVEALGKLEPAALSWGTGTLDFPVSRRMPAPNGVIMAPNAGGLADHDVPVLRVASTADDKLRAVLFGAACHNVACGRANVTHGDFAGSAHLALQAAHPGAVALFMAGCSADANPQPMGSPDLADRHGKTLANEVECLLAGGGDALRPVSGALSTRLTMTALPLQSLDRKGIEAYLPVPNFQSLQAKHMLDVLDAGGTLPRSYDAPIAVWQFGAGPTLVALPGEPVAGYVPLIRQALGGRNVWVAGYNNDCFGYLPTAAVIKEGGHEAIGVTLWAWGQDLDRSVGFFAPEVEDVVVGTAKDLATNATRKQ